MSKHYRPLTLARAGELAAVGHLSASSHLAITPIFQVPPREWDFETGDYKKSVAGHLSTLPDKLFNARGAYPAFLDTGLLDSESLIDGLHPLEYLIREAAALELPLTPAVAPDRSSSSDAAVRNLHDDFGLGAAILLDETQWVTVAPSALSDTLVRLGLAVEDVDVVIDYGASDGRLVEAEAVAEVIAVTVWVRSARLRSEVAHFLTSKVWLEV